MPMAGKKIVDLSVEVVGNGFQVKISTIRDGILGKLGFTKSGDYVATSSPELVALCADLVRSCVNGGPVTFKETQLVERP
jgi:hypothetical protein